MFEIDTPATEEWEPIDYSPELSVEEWIELLNDKEVFTTDSLEIMKRMKDYGGQAICKQFSIKYGKDKNFYNSGSSNLARRVAKKSNCPTPPESPNSRWWPILYVGRFTRKGEEGRYMWKLRTELSKALDKIDLTHIPLYAHSTYKEEEHNYWWLDAKPSIWSFSDIAVGETQAFTLYNDSGNKRRIFQNFLDAKVGDMVIGYESHPVKQIVVIAKVFAEQNGEKIYFEKVEGLLYLLIIKSLRVVLNLKKQSSSLIPQALFLD